MRRSRLITVRALMALAVALWAVAPDRGLVAQQIQVRDPAPRLPRPVRLPRTGPSSQALSLQLTADRARRIAMARSRRLDYVPGEAIVKFRAGTTTAERQRALSALGGRPALADLKWIGDAAVVRDTAELDARAIAAALAAQPEVEYAEPNYVMKVPRRGGRPARTDAGAGAIRSTPDDANFDEQWNFTALDMPRAWDIQPGGSSDLIVAVIDTGVTTVNQSFTVPLFTGSRIETVTLPFSISPDLSPAKFVGARDFVFGPPGEAVLDLDGHGTHVASTIVEDTNNGLGNAGMAYNVRLMPLKACLGFWDIQIILAMAGEPGYVDPGSSDCPLDAVAQAIDYAVQNGARVINLSLGGPSPSIAIRNAIVNAVNNGVFVSISNGNSGDLDNPVEYPSGDAQSIAGAMSVAAVGRSLERAYYSTFGSQTEIAAPGGDDQDGGEDGLVWQVTLNPEFMDPFDASILIPRFDRYARVGYQGTSQAAPHVGGLAALLMSQGIGNPAAIEHLIVISAKDLGAPGRDDEFGQGLIQPRAALFGFGIRK
jgi:serine protease